MKKEIERKFIVSSTAYKKLGEYEHCIQGYIPSINSPLIRIRTIGKKSFITIDNEVVAIDNDIVWDSAFLMRKINENNNQLFTYINEKNGIIQPSDFI